MKVAILYGSDTGKTEAVARRLHTLFPGSTLVSAGHSSAADLVPFDMVLVGTSTWGTGSLPEAWARRLSHFPPGCLEGKILGFFGLGDRVAFADTFCQAVSTLTERFRPGARLVLTPSLLLDDDNNGGETEGLTAAWVRRIKDQTSGNR